MTDRNFSLLTAKAVIGMWPMRVANYAKQQSALQLEATHIEDRKGAK